MPKSPRNSHSDYSDDCIYTIRHSGMIKKLSQSVGPHTIDTKHKAWTTAKKMVADASKRNKVVPLLFAPAEDTTDIVACADLLSVKAGRTNTVTFKNVRYLPQPIRKTTLTKRDGTKVDKNFIREYLICKTPPLASTGNLREGKSELRRSPAAASEIVRQLVPEKYLKPLLKAVVHSINVANDANPAKWGLRLNQDGAMLKVGFVEVLQVRDGWFHQLVKSDLVPKKLRSDRRIRFSDRPPYKNAPGCITCNLNFPMLALAYPALLQAHEAAIRIAAGSPRHTSTTKDHSPGLILFISHELNEPMPQPSYYEASDQSDAYIPEEVPDDEEFEEGAVVQVLVNRYERDSAAREKCIKHFGTKCSACHMSLADRYGPTVSGLIHVHHLTPLSSIGKKSAVNPMNDLRPVCPNCHAVIHSAKPPLTIEQVKKMVR